MLIRFLLSLLLIAFTPLTGCDRHASDKEEIAAVLDELDRCNNAKDGNGVLAVFTKSSYPHFEPMIKVALDGTPEQVRALRPTEMEEVFLIRLFATRAEVANLSGMEYERFATGRGWYALPPYQQSETKLKRFRFNQAGTEAWAEGFIDNQSSGFKYHFVKEEDYWRYDEPHLLSQVDRDVKNQARDEGIPVHEMVIELLEKRLGKSIPDKVWEPMP